MESTIVAIATPCGMGALAVLRLSGSQAGEIITKCFSKSQSLLSTPRRATLGCITDQHGAPLDEVLATYFQEPASFTGEDIIELSCHGGVYVSQVLQQRLIQCGAHAANPGEFTQRAFLNGKLDLTQAEGVMDIISAQTDLALKAAQGQLQGSIQTVTQALRETLISLTAHIEAHIDFPEDDISPETQEQLLARLDQVLSQCQSLLSTSQTGRLLRDGARIAIVGEPNAGKSSLLNCILGYERALVSTIKGTTRDTVEETINLGGIPARFVDTAGLRPTQESVEQLGISRTHQEIQTADLIIEVLDATLAPSTVTRVPIPENSNHLTIFHKSDLDPHPDWDLTTGTPFSSVSQASPQNLLDTLTKILTSKTLLSGDTIIAINARHQSCLLKIQHSVQDASLELENKTDPELVAVPLREALEAIGDLTGRIDTEDILSSIFSQFCIGK